MTTAGRFLDSTLPNALGSYEHWRTKQAGFSPKTWAGEKPGLVSFLDAMLDNGLLYVRTIEAEHVEAWFDQLDLADSTKVTRLSQLRSFLQYCINRGWLTNDPSVLLRARKTARRPRRRLTADQLLVLPEKAGNPRDRVLLALAVNLGVRGGEIARLRIRDVSLVTDEITVQVDKTAEIDVMPITAELGAELRTWLKVYQSVATIGADSYVVPSQYWDNYNARWIYRPDRVCAKPYAVVQKVLEADGWDVKGEGVHTLRRSVARVYFDMMEADESYDSALLATMTLLHHTRPETTIEYIGRTRPQLARDRVLKGKPFLSRLAGDNVVNLRSAQ